MHSSSQKKGQQQQPTVSKTRIITTSSFGLLASLLVLSLVTAIQMTTSNNAAYAQTSGDLTLNIECVLDDEGSPIVSWRIDNIASIKPASGAYGYVVLKGDEIILSVLTEALPELNLFPDPIIGSSIGQPGQEYTLQVVVNDEFALEGSEVIASKTVTCPLPLTEQFQNQGQCMREANTNPSSGITKEDCRAAFKA